MRADRSTRSNPDRRRSDGFDAVSAGPDESRPPGDDLVAWSGVRSQRNDKRFGGQYVSVTGPIRLLRGTVPQVRESHECMRLSPMTK